MAMRNIRILLTMALLTASMSIFAQLNPIQNLFFQVNSYEYGNFNCPEFNCHTLTWTKPDSSYTDTLIGYKIFKNNQFYKFTTIENASCDGYCLCLYLDFYFDLPYWLTVKAVYNSDSILSVANDSILINDYAINIEEITTKEIVINENPIRLGDNISILIPYCQTKNGIIQVVSYNGQLIKEYPITDLSDGDLVIISSSGLSRGLYLINYKTDTFSLATKLIIE